MHVLVQKKIGTFHPEDENTSPERGFKSMEQTSNYQLSQWEAQDRILREDFNTNNMKLDQALAEINATNSYVKVLDVTLAADTPSWTIDMSSIDLRDYQKLILYPRLIRNGTQYANLHINQDSETCGNIPATSNSSTSRQGIGFMEVTLMYVLPYLFVSCYGIKNLSSSSELWEYKYAPTPLADGVYHLDTLDIEVQTQQGQLVLAGSTIQIYGLQR